MKSASEEELQRRRKGREGGYSLVHVSSGGCSAGLYHSVMAGHEIESEAGVCKKKILATGCRDFLPPSPLPSPKHLNLAFNLGCLGDLKL